MADTTAFSTKEVDNTTDRSRIAAMAAYVSPQLRTAVSTLVRLATSRGRALNRTQVVKLLYFGDLRSVEIDDRPITGASWWWHNHGPFDDAVYQALEDLEGVGEITHNVQRGSIVEHIYTSVGSANNADGELAAILDSVLEDLGSRTGTSLGELSYTTPAMLAVQKSGRRGDVLDIFAGSAAAELAARYDARMDEPLPDTSPEAAAQLRQLLGIQ